MPVQIFNVPMPMLTEFHTVCQMCNVICTANTYIMPLKNIIPGEIYQWGDHTTHLGLEHVVDLDLESKRKTLFGRCDIEQHFTPAQAGTAILFETYISLNLAHSDIQQIYFPSVFLQKSFNLQIHLDSNWTWSTHRSHSVACVMRQPRYLRLIASCWLANNADHIDFVYTQNWDPVERLPGLYELLQIGGIKDWTGEWGPDLLQLPERRLGSWHDHDLCANFAMLYDAVYSRAAAAVVIGAVCWEQGAEICEKYLFAVLSGCIPIVQGYRVYDSLARMGFDTFDDVIDTASQWETNPVMSAWNMWEHNRDFFRQAKHIAADVDIQRRLRHNFDLAQDLKQLSLNSISSLNNAEARDLWYKHELWNHLSWTVKHIPLAQWFAC